MSPTWRACSVSRNWHYAYRILSAQTVSDGMPIRLAHELQMSSEDRVGRSESLLDTIEARGFNIGRILADSESASGRMASVLKERGIDLVIQVPIHWVRSHVDDFGAHPRYTMNKKRRTRTARRTRCFASRETKLGKQKHPAMDDAQKALLDFFEPAPECLSGNRAQETLDAFLDEDDEKGRWYCFITLAMQRYRSELGTHLPKF